jgi:hypothetical protein
MSNPFAVARKYLPSTDEQQQSSVVESDTIHAVKIFSRILADKIWLIFDRSFIPSDGLAIYYPEELAELGSKTPEQLREIHKVKLVFPGARVIQEGAEE